jgi:hypothetical protein
MKKVTNGKKKALRMSSNVQLLDRRVRRTQHSEDGRVVQTESAKDDERNRTHFMKAAQCRRALSKDGVRRRDDEDVRLVQARESA